MHKPRFITVSEFFLPPHAPALQKNFRALECGACEVGAPRTLDAPATVPTLSDDPPCDPDGPSSVERSGDRVLATVLIHSTIPGRSAMPISGSNDKIDIARLARMPFVNLALDSRAGSMAFVRGGHIEGRVGQPPRACARAFMSPGAP